MRFTDHILDNHPFNLRYRRRTVGNYDGFYHYHRGIELLIVHEGTGHVVLNRKMYSLHPYSIMFVQPFQLHRVDFEVSTSSPYDRSVITFEPTNFLPFFQMFPTIRRFFEHMWKDELPVQVFQIQSKQDQAYLDALLDHYQPQLAEKSEFDPIEAASMLIISMFDYLRPLDEASGSTIRIPRAERHAEKIMQWIEEHYTEPFDLEQLARELHLSKHHISHLFRLETGSSITDYLIARRIRQACWLLKTESASIEQIGASVGIPNFSYFCRLFRKMTELTPKEYRNHALMN